MKKSSDDQLELP
jgi:hypothetical protein